MLENTSLGLTYLITADHLYPFHPPTTTLPLSTTNLISVFMTLIFIKNAHVSELFVFLYLTHFTSHNAFGVSIHVVWNGMVSFFFMAE